MGASRVLTQANAKQTERAAKMGALGQVATSLVLQGGKNMQSEGQRQKVGKDGKGMTKLGQDGVSQVPDMETVRGSFFSPVNEQGQKVQGFGNRLGYSDFMNISPF